MPLCRTYRPDPRVRELPGTLYDEVRPARFPEHTLRWRNQRAAAEVGLHLLSDTRWLDHMARFEPLPNNLEQPLALRYHGHQFRHYNPELGDGRGFLFAQLRDPDQRLLDLGTKGSGTTPWSRGGDGRLTLQGGVREILAAEFLQATGVPTCRILSLVETGEELLRGDEPSPTRSAVLVRLSHSHIRFGTFQRLAYTGDTDSLAALIDYSLTHLLPEAPPGDVPALRLLAAVMPRMARTTAGWMAAGFVHGVLNTDNMNLTGESFDYGPWRFLTRYDPSHTAAYFDHQSLYAYGRQPRAVEWNLYRLAECLLDFATPEQLGEVLAPFEAHYLSEMTEQMARRLGLAEAPTADQLAALFATLSTQDVAFEAFLFDHVGGSSSRAAQGDTPRASLYAAEAFAPHRDWLLGSPRPAAAQVLAHPLWRDPVPPTNHNSHTRALWQPIHERDDWSPLQEHLDRLRAYGDALAPLMAR